MHELALAAECRRQFGRWRADDVGSGDGPSLQNEIRDQFIILQDVAFHSVDDELCVLSGRLDTVGCHVEAWRNAARSGGNYVPNEAHVVMWHDVMETRALGGP